MVHIRFYNKLPSHVQDLSINKLKLLIKRKLCQKAFYSVKDYLEDKKAWDSAASMMYMPMFILRLYTFYFLFVFLYTFCHECLLC